MTPMPFREALERVSQSAVLPSTLSHAELGQIASSLRERTFTAARVANAEALQRLRDTVTQIVDGKLTGTGARKELRDIGLPPARIDLIVSTNVELARGYGNWRQAQEPEVLDQYPAWEFFRAEQRMEPRVWPERWAEAGGTFFEGESDYSEGRMVALANDPIWTAISAFGLPFPPFDFNSGMYTRDIARDEAEELGLLAPGEDAPEPEQRDFAKDETYTSPSELDDDLKAQLLSDVGEDYEFDEDGVLTRKKVTV